MQFSQSILISLAIASTANGLVIPTIEKRDAAPAEPAAAPAFSIPKSKIIRAPENGIKNKYIVVLKDGADTFSVKSTFEGSHKEVGANYAHHFDFDFVTGFKGFAAEIASNVLEKLADLDDVLFVEQDTKVYALEVTQQSGAPWGLARISSKASVNGTTTGTYLYDSEGGSGVTSYIVDTGINYTHEEFEGRAKWGITFPTDGDADSFGHGTHCAGTIGGKTYGVAKKANLVAVKVLGNDGHGSNSDVIKGINYVASEHKKSAKKPGYKGTTANLSLGTEKSYAMNRAANAAVAAGVHIAVSAGNDNIDACKFSPASADHVITVGATDNKDAKASFSNYGECVDIFGPGVNVLSAWIGSNTANKTISGTSMAAPHITGLLTYFLSLAPERKSFFGFHNKFTPSDLKKAIVAFGTPDAISNVGKGSPNVLAYNGAGENLSEFWAKALSA